MESTTQTATSVAAQAWQMMKVKHTTYGGRAVHWSTDGCVYQLLLPETWTWDVSFFFCITLYITGTHLSLSLSLCTYFFFTYTYIMCTRHWHLVVKYKEIKEQSVLSSQCLSLCVGSGGWDWAWYRSRKGIISSKSDLLWQVAFPFFHFSIICYT